jgi:hypothetical protein
VPRQIGDLERDNQLHLAVENLRYHVAQQLHVLGLARGGGRQTFEVSEPRYQVGVTDG